MKKLMYLVCSVLMLGPVLMDSCAEAALIDGVVAYWPFDDNAEDMAGSNNGTLVGNASYVDGKLGKAVSTSAVGSAEDYVQFDTTSDGLTGAWTVATWIYVHNQDVGAFIDGYFGDPGAGDAYTLRLPGQYKAVNYPGMGNYQTNVNAAWDGVMSQTQEYATPLGTWTLIVFVGSDTQCELFADGVSQGTVVYADMGDMIHKLTWDRLGHLELYPSYGNAKADFDELAIWDRALTQEEVLELWNNGDGTALNWETASGATPKNRATDVLHDSDLSWAPGIYAATHDVYVGENFEDVNTATVPTAPGLDVNSLDLDRLDFGKTIYWRVDEVNGTPDKTVFRGLVWSFEVEPYSIPIAGSEIIATASSSSSESSLPQKTLDGSGLGEDESHGIQTETMWFSAMGDMEPWIQYEFDGVKKLDIMTVWNSNSAAEGFIGYGVMGVEIAYSVDGETWNIFEDVNEFTRAPGSPSYNQYDEINLGGLAAKMIRLNIQSNFGGFMQSYSLSEVQFSMIPAAARMPVPESGSVDISPDAVLSWRAGRQAVQSTVYLSTDPNEVADGLAASVTSNTNSINLSAFDAELGETYYWRVDEVNEAEVESVWAGPVWSFSTVATMIVDDFESYNNDSPNRPFQVWLDGFGYSADEFFLAAYGGNGTGAGIGHDIWSVASEHYNGDIMETANTMPGSSQSMPFYYSNSGGVASQTERTFAAPQDWTVGGAQTLSIAFSGQTGNTGTLYAKINNTKLTYPHAASNIAMGVWQAWNIDLTSMNVQNVTTLQIGVDGSGVSGMILIDDIKLHPTTGELIVPVEPDAAGLVGHWMFDESSGTTATDSSGNNNHGDVMGDAQWVAGKVGGALAFDGADDMVVVNQNGGLPIYNNGTDNTYSVAMWVKGGPQNDMRIFSEGSTTSGTPLLNLGTQDSGQFASYIRPDTGTISNHPLSQGEPFDDTWHHIAWVDDNGTATLYIDGLLDGGDFNYTRGTMALNTTTIGGILRAAPSHFFTGLIDEVVIYDRALSAGEALWLAGVTTPMDKPF